jgi:hypothetical protein
MRMTLWPVATWHAGSAERGLLLRSVLAPARNNVCMAGRCFTEAAAIIAVYLETGRAIFQLIPRWSDTEALQESGEGS